MNKTRPQPWEGAAILRDAERAILRADSSLATKYRVAAVGSPEDDSAWRAFNGRHWLSQQTLRWPLHPAVKHLFIQYRPADWQRVVCERPHISTTDPARLAYTRDERSGKDDRQTITSVGKYLRRHWPNLPDHVIRDAVALHAPDKIEYGTGIQFLIRGVELGPRSCMQSSFGAIPFGETCRDRLVEWLANPDGCEEPPWERHPYSVYLPEYGWGMAIRTNTAGEVLGRCLTWTDPDDDSRKLYVRSYARNPGGDHASSGSDHAIEAWLQEAGFERASAWPEGAKFDKVDHPRRGVMMPYLDADCTDSRRVDDMGGYLVRDDRGDFTCDNTDGSATEENCAECDRCGDRVNEDDLTYIVGTEESVCPHCRSNHYSYVRGSAETSRHRGSWYYTRDDDAAPLYTSYRNMSRGVEEEYIDTSNPPDDVIQTEDGTWGSEDDVVRCTDGEYRFVDDPDVVELAEECPDTGESYAHTTDAWEDGDGEWHSDHVRHVTVDGDWYPEDDCWQCAGTGLWYRDTAECVEDDDGRTYSPDYLARVNTDAEPAV